MLRSNFGNCSRWICCVYGAVINWKSVRKEPQHEQIHPTFVSLMGWHSIWWETDAVWFIFAPQMLLLWSNKIPLMQLKVSSDFLRLPPSPSWPKQKVMLIILKTAELLFLVVMKLHQRRYIQTHNLFSVFCLSLAVNALSSSSSPLKRLCAASHVADRQFI